MNFEEQIMFKDKYPSIFSSQMAASVFIMLQIISLRNIRSRDAFKPIARETVIVLN